MTEIPLPRGKFRKMNPYGLIPGLSSLLYIFLSLKSVSAGPYPKDDLHDIGYSYLLDRRCASHCGADNQYCCAAGQACYTNEANIAFCSAVAPDAGLGYTVFTTTYTETNLILRTSTFTSSWVIATPTEPGPRVTAEPICTTSLGETSCGNICCASNQRCAVMNSCTAHTPQPGDPTEPSTYSAPLRPTSGHAHTTSATTTIPFQHPATASGSVYPVTETYEQNDLSGGAIAGIVIGVIAGVILLLLVCSFILLKKKFSKKTGIGSSRRNSSSKRVDFSITTSGSSEKRDNRKTKSPLAEKVQDILFLIKSLQWRGRKRASSKSRRSDHSGPTHSQTSTSPSNSELK